MRYKHFGDQIIAHIAFLRAHGLGVEHLRIGEGFIKRSIKSHGYYLDYAHRSAKFFLKRLDLVGLKTTLRLPNGDEVSFKTMGDMEYEFDVEIKPCKQLIPPPRLIGSLLDAKQIGIAVDYNTARICQQLTGIPTVCISSVLRMPAVAQQIRKKYPHLRVIFFADNNRHQKKNEGMFIAEKAMRVLDAQNAVIAAPYFREPRCAGSTWGDLLKLKGKEVVLRQLKAQLQPSAKKHPELVADVSLEIVWDPSDAIFT